MATAKTKTTTAKATTTAAKVEEKKAETTTKAKAADKKVEAKAADKKVEAKTTEKKTTKKATTKKPVAKKSKNVYVQFAGMEFDAAAIEKAIKADYTAKNGKKTMTSVNIYIKPEDMKAYYVIDGIIGDIAL